MNRDPVTTPLQLAHWFEARLHDSLGFCFPATRMYGLELLDVHGLDGDDPAAARASFIVEADDPLRLWEQPEARRAADFDAVAIVSTTWMEPPLPAPQRPGRYATRRRARVVTVRTADGTASVARFEHAPDAVVPSPAA